MVDSLVREQQKLGHHCSIITRWRPWIKSLSVKSTCSVWPFLPRRKDPLGHAGEIGPSNMIRIMVKLWQALGQFDVWHIHEVYPLGVQIGRVLSEMRVPYILTSHGDDLRVDKDSVYGWRLYEPHKRRIKNFLHSMCPLTAISRGVFETYIESGAVKKQITIIPNGVDYERISAVTINKNEIKKRYRWPLDRKIIINVGRNSPIKGLSVVSDVMHGLKKKGLNPFWVFIGPDMDKLGAELSEKGFREDISVLPPMINKIEDHHDGLPPNQLVECIKAADVFFFPTMSEGFGLIMLEVMASGIPIISTKATGVIDIGESGKDCFLTEVGSVDQMIKSISNVLTDEKIHQKFSDNGIKKSLKYSWAIIAQQYVDLYQSLVNQRDS